MFSNFYSLINRIHRKQEKEKKIRNIFISGKMIIVIYVVFLV